MKQLLFIFCALIVLTGYDPVTDEVYYDEYRPIVVSRDVLEASVSLESQRALENPGRIYLKGDYLYIVEKFKGVHVINNADPSNPLNSGFIRIPGCLNMAIKGDLMYADNSVDLVSVDISSTNSIHVVNRKRNVFPEPTPPNDSYIPWQYERNNRPENTFIVDYVKVEEE